MKMVKVSDNVLANPECISRIEKKFLYDRPSITVCFTDGSEFELKAPLDQFLKEIYESDDDGDLKQNFVG